jgi:hypothetical protein
LDDERTPPAGWTHVRTAQDAIELLKAGKVDEISLDHDLGDDAKGTGYDVILWIEEAVFTRDFDPPQITVHSANPSARLKMKAAVQSIYRLHAKDQTR